MLMCSTTNLCNDALLSRAVLKFFKMALLSYTQAARVISACLLGATLTRTSHASTAESSCEDPQRTTHSS